jgi:hypothetical protein
MKKLFLLFTSLCCFGIIKAQVNEHDGFYLSMGLGPVFGSITDKSSSFNFTYSGTGAEFDFKIGGTIQENLILHATMDSKSIVGPNIKNGSISVSTSNNLSISEGFLGGGLTYYIMPANIFVSSSLGIGYYGFVNTDNNTNIATQKGLGIQLKLGKEWWVSANWGLGIGITYGKSNLTNKADGISEDLDSNRFGILFNATFN